MITGLQPIIMPGLLDIPVEIRYNILRYAVEPSEIKVCDHNRGFCDCEHSPSSFVELIDKLLITPLLICRTINAELSITTKLRKFDFQFCTYDTVSKCLLDAPMSVKAPIRSISFHASVLWRGDDKKEAFINQIRKNRVAGILGKEVSVDIVRDPPDYFREGWIKIVVTELDY